MDSTTQITGNSATDPVQAVQMNQPPIQREDENAKSTMEKDITNIATNGSSEKVPTCTSQTPPIDHLKLEKEILELRLKVSEIEKQTYNDKLEREKLETKVDAIPDYRDELIPVGRTLNAKVNYRLDVFRDNISALEEEEKMINTLMKDRDRLLVQEKKWEAERQRLEQLIKTRKDTDQPDGVKSDEDPDSENKADNTQPIDLEVSVLQSGKPEQSVEKYANPELNRIEWSTFRVLHAAAEDESFAIDILVGDPVIAFNSLNTPWWIRNRSFGVNDATERKVNLNLRKQALIPGQPPLPERIRIHSRLILSTLDKIHGDGDLSSAGVPVVMVRPYKGLTYYEHQIRQRIKEIEAKLNKSDQTKTPSVKDEPKKTEKDENTQNLNGDGKTDAQLQPVTTNEDNLGAGDEGQEKSLGDSYKHLKCLLNFMETEINVKSKYLTSDSCQKVAFADLWHLFRPGDLVMGNDRRQAYRIICVTSTPHKVILPWQKYARKSEKSKKSGQPSITLMCVYVDFDGKQLGPVICNFEIESFDGERAATALEVYPLRFAGKKKGENEVEKIRQMLVERGRMFLEVAGVKHMQYNGFTLESRDEVDGQVVIDFEESFSPSSNGNDRWKPRIDSLIGAQLVSNSGDDDDNVCSAECCRDESIYNDSYAEKKQAEDYIASLMPEDSNREPSVTIYPRNLADTKSPENELTEDELAIMSFRVFGFVLRSRKWAKLDLTYLTPLDDGEDGDEDFDDNLVSHGQAEVREEDEDEDEDDFVDEFADEEEQGKKDENLNSEQDLKNTEGKKVDGSPEIKKKKRDTAFEQLVLPRGHKDMLRSLISQHFRDKKSEASDNEQRDIVRGKGKGLIILLHGAPGVGKTTTAEGMAETFRKPLFQITCGDLGTTATDVEGALETHFALASRWDCILLLDEADVFLAERSIDDFQRNGLVAVFLRVLEYYSGILFLTTNRIGDFDEAFTSRIHMSLYYPELDLKSTLAVFRLNLRLIRNRFKERERNIYIDPEIVKFAKTYWLAHPKMRWNGRQIRNACQTSLALAEFRASGNRVEKIVHANAKVNLTVDDLKTVSDAYLDFLEYLRDIYGESQEGRAKHRQLRARAKNGRMSKQEKAHALAEDSKSTPTKSVNISSPKAPATQTAPLQVDSRAAPQLVPATNPPQDMPGAPRVSDPYFAQQAAYAQQMYAQQMYAQQANNQRNAPLMPGYPPPMNVQHLGQPGQVPPPLDAAAWQAVMQSMPPGQNPYGNIPGGPRPVSSNGIPPTDQT